MSVCCCVVVSVCVFVLLLKGREAKEVSAALPPLLVSFLLVVPSLLSVEWRIENNSNPNTTNGRIGSFTPPAQYQETTTKTRRYPIQVTYYIVYTSREHILHGFKARERSPLSYTPLQVYGCGKQHERRTDGRFPGVE